VLLLRSLDLHGLVTVKETRSQTKRRFVVSGVLISFFFNHHGHLGPVIRGMRFSLSLALSLSLSLSLCLSVSLSLSLSLFLSHPSLSIGLAHAHRPRARVRQPWARVLGLRSCAVLEPQHRPETGKGGLSRGLAVQGVASLRGFKFPHARAIVHRCCCLLLQDLLPSC
jgi:hypothetical protein